MKLLLMGAPGSGKGTLAKKLAQEKNIEHLSTGDILRIEVKNQTELGKKVSLIMKSGHLVSDKLMLDLIANRISSLDSFALDGFPRTFNQVNMLDKIVSIDKALHLKVNDEIVIKRLIGRRHCGECEVDYNIYFSPPLKENICDNCGRDLQSRKDDNKSTIKKRLNVFHQNFDEIILYYKKQDKLIEVDASIPPDLVAKKIFSILF